jgi:hypothetical protein
MLGQAGQQLIGQSLGGLPLPRPEGDGGRKGEGRVEHLGILDEPSGFQHGPGVLDGGGQVAAGEPDPR